MKLKELKISEMRMATHIPTRFGMCGTPHSAEKTVQSGSTGERKITYYPTLSCEYLNSTKPNLRKGDSKN